MSFRRGEDPLEDAIDRAANLFRRRGRRRVPSPPPEAPKEKPKPKPPSEPKPPPPPQYPYAEPSEPQPQPLTDDEFLKKFVKKVLESQPSQEEKLHATYLVTPELLVSDENVRNFYRPKVVSIGPYHYHKKESLRPMEAFKGKCLYKLINKHHPLDESHEGLELLRSCFSRMIEQEESLRPMQDFKWKCLYKLIHEHPPLPEGRHKAFELLRSCFSKMIEKEGWIREHYSKEIKLTDQELARMMLLDGGFILYLLLKEAKEIEYEIEDLQPIIGRVWIWHLVQQDLLLLENQIPFFVIRDLYNILVPDGCRYIKLVDMALEYFSILDPCRKQKQTPKFNIPEDDVLHLLHLFYLSVLPCPQYYKPSKSQEWIPSAMKLKDFGVKFKKRKNENQCRFLSFLDIKFNDACGVIEIPQLRLHDYSVSLFRNLVAFEHSYPDTNCYITAYVAFMNCLIDEKTDRRSLQLDQILVSSITMENDKTDFFRRLCNGTQYASNKNYLGGLINDVNKYHGRTLPTFRAQLARFRGPWPIIALAFTIVAFLSQVTQVIKSFFS